jgi:hypothetical protein
MGKRRKATQKQILAILGVLKNLGDYHQDLVGNLQDSLNLL